MAERTKRINLVVSHTEWKMLSSVAKRKNVPVTELLRSFSRFGLEVSKMNATVVLREEGKEERVVYIA